MNKRTEAMIDIALMAGHLIATNNITVNDSRKLVQVIEELADEFEQKFNPDRDYIEDVDNFAREHLEGRCIG